MPLLAFPLALLGLIALPALVGVYVLRNRFKKHPVSSLMLWEQQMRSKEGGAQVTRLQTPLTLVLELLALLFLVLAAVDPRWRIASNTNPLIVVLDDSASMQAISSNGMARDQARKKLLQEIKDGDWANIRILFAGNEVFVAGPPVNTAAEVEEQLKGWSCSTAHASISEAIAMASEIGERNARIAIITDQPAQAVEDGGRIKWIAVGQALGNRAIINANRSPGDQKDRCLLEIANHSPNRSETTLKVSGRPDQVLNLSPGAVERVIFEVPRETDSVIAEISADALAMDNRVVLVRQQPRVVKIKYDLESSGMENLIRGGLNAGPTHEEGEVNPHWLITDRHGRELPSPDTWVFTVLPDAKPLPFTGPFVMNTEHPLTRGLALQGCVWGAAATNNSFGTPLISAGNLTLLAANENGLGRQSVSMHFNPKSSTLQRHPNWPILLYNLMDWRASQLPGVETPNVRVGSEVNIRCMRGVDTVSVSQPSNVRGPSQTLPVSRRQATFFPREPGLYSLDIGGRPVRVSANFLSGNESDLQGNVSGTWGDWTNQASIQREYASFSWVLILLVLGLLLGHLFLVHRKSKV